MKRALPVLFLLLLACTALAQDKALPIPKLSVEVGKATKPEDVAVTLREVLGELERRQGHEG